MATPASPLPRMVVSASPPLSTRPSPSPRALLLLSTTVVSFAAFAVSLVAELTRVRPEALPRMALAEGLTHESLVVLLLLVPATHVAAEWMPPSVATYPSPSSPSSIKADAKQSTPSGRSLPHVRAFQGVAALLYAIAVAVGSLCPPSSYPLSRPVLMAVLGFLAQILVVSSVLAVEPTALASASTSTSTPSTSTSTPATQPSRKERRMVMQHNFNNMLLVVAALLLAISSELARRELDEFVAVDLATAADMAVNVDLAVDLDVALARRQHSLTSGLGSLAFVVTAVFNTHGLGGLLLAAQRGWHFYQPFAGGARFMFFQAVSWTCFACGLVLQSLYLFSLVIVEVELAVGAVAAAAALFLVAEVVMMMSLLVFQPQPSTLSSTSTTTLSATSTPVAHLRPFQRRLRAFAQDCLGALLIGTLANLPWVPSVFFAALYAATTTMSPPQVLQYTLATTLLEFLLVATRSVTAHWSNRDARHGPQAHVHALRLRYLLPQAVALAVPALLSIHHLVHTLPARVPITLLSLSGYVYMFTYRGQPEVTGHRHRPQWATQLSIFFDTIAGYFTGRILCDAPSLDASSSASASGHPPYVMAFHPHGIMATTVMWLPFSSQWRALFPHLHPHILTASILHQIPLVRDVLQLLGSREVTRQAFATALQQNETVLVVPGGQAEMLEQRSQRKQVRVYTRHRGFLRLAIEHGAPLVPVLSFQEGETMDNIDVAPLLQRWFVKKVAFPFPYLPYGRLYLPIPRKTALTIAVGAPLPVDQHEHPTDEQVDVVHRQYFAALRDLFERHKKEADCDDYELVLL